MIDGAGKSGPAEPPVLGDVAKSPSAAALCVTPGKAAKARGPIGFAINQRNDCEVGARWLNPLPGTQWVGKDPGGLSGHKAFENGIGRLNGRIFRRKFDGGFAHQVKPVNVLVLGQGPGQG